MQSRFKQTTVILFTLIAILLITSSQIKILAANDFAEHPFNLEEQGYYRLRLKLPQSYDFKSESSDYQDEEIILYRTEEQGLAVNEDIEYELNLNGYIFSGQGIYLTEEDLYLKRLEIEMPDKIRDRIYYNKKNIEIEALDNKMVFKDVAIAANENRVIGEYKCKHNYYLSFGEWIIDVTSSRLSEEEIFASGKLKLKSLYLDLDLVIDQMLVGRDLAGREVELNDFEVELFSGAKLAVQDAVLTESQLLVKEAQLTYLKEDSFEVELGNFQISPDGSFEIGSDYYSDPAELNYYGVDYQIPADKLFFNNRAITIEKAVRDVEAFEQQIAVGPLRINAKEYKVIPWLGSDLNGILFEAINGVREGDQFLFKEGQLYLDIADESIIISLKDIKYGPNGIDFNSAEVVPDQFVYQDYGQVIYDDLIFVDGKFQLAGEFKLNEKFLEQEIKFAIKEFIVDNNSSKQMEIVGDKELTLLGLDFKLSALEIDQLAKFDLAVKLPANKRLSKLPKDDYQSVDRFNFNQQGDLVELKAEFKHQDKIELDNDYQLELRDIKLVQKEDSEQLRFAFTGGALWLPSYHTGGYIWLEDFGLDSEGNLKYGETDFASWFLDYKKELAKKFENAN